MGQQQWDGCAGLCMLGSALLEGQCPEPGLLEPSCLVGLHGKAGWGGSG